MNKGLWIARKNYLFTLIKKVSDSQGGDTLEFLNQHFNEVVGNYQDESIEEAIDCYQKVLECLNRACEYNKIRG